MLQKDNVKSGYLLSTFLAVAFFVGGCETGTSHSKKLEAVSNFSETEMEEISAPPKRWLLGEQAEYHYSASCPEGTPFIEPEAIELNATPIKLQNVNTPEALPISILKAAELSGVEFVAGYHLTSDDPRLGGISGIEALADGSLLTVTDQGDFLWLGMDEFDHLQPVSAKISTIRDSKGRPFDSKWQADSEGLAVDNGLALVSFEQNHRIEAFDLETCGSNARGSRILSLDKKRHNVSKLSDNGGMEALALTNDGGLIIGIESLDDNGAQISFSPKHKVSNFVHRIKAGGNKKMTGSDYLPLNENSGELYSLHRSYTPLTGTHIRLLKTSVSKNDQDEFSLGSSEELLYLKPPGITDNFEGITVRREEDGVIRLFIVSDDNFSPKQRSLLLIFNVEARAY